ncbi:unnamed protein product [marine sediment metagenome]|uniref:Uncharacterized protein n=1 Tax=marine sediment metagenome TaxID=412755 RepID=X0UD18_9ZZZZ
MDNRERKEHVLSALDRLMDVQYIDDDINTLIDDAYNLLDEAAGLLTLILEEED